jgi:hypothetical protein
MRVFQAVLLILVVLTSPCAAQANLVPDNGGTGVDGAAIAPPGTVVLDTAVKQLFQFTSLSIGVGSTVNVVGPFPIVIKVQGAVQIDGILNVSGANGASGGNNVPGGAGGAGGPGGGSGGSGGASALAPFVGTGIAGTGPGGGQPGIDSGVVGGPLTDPVGGGGGGGNATAGNDGGPPNAGGVSAAGAGGFAVFFCRAGSGGGGGGGDIDSATLAAGNDGGGGGGGGGGDIILTSNVSITVNGSLLANGGAGGMSGNGGAGGGGSGGAIELHAPSVTVNGLVQALGGSGGATPPINCGCSPGGAGGTGCIVIGAATIAVAGAVSPGATTTPLSLILVPPAPASGLIVSAQTATSNYIVAVALNAAAVPIVLPAGTFFLDLADPILNLLVPVNTLPGIFNGVTGTGSGFVGIDVSSLGLPLGTEINLLAQGGSFTPTLAIDGITPLVPVRIRF